MMNLTGVTALSSLGGLTASAPAAPSAGPASSAGSALLADLQANLGSTSSSVNALGDAASDFQVSLPAYKPMPAIDANATHDTAPTADDPSATDGDPSAIQEKSPAQPGAAA